MPCFVAHLKVSYESEHHPRAEFFGAGVTGCWWGRSALGWGTFPGQSGAGGAGGRFRWGRSAG